MTLKKREKIMAISAVALLTVMVLYWFWPSGDKSLAELRDQRDQLTAKVEKAKILAAQAKKSAERLAAWQRRALPADPETARSLYHTWLRELVDRVDFHKQNLTAVEGQSPKGVYTSFTFNIQCQGTLDKLTRFLYEFYSAGHLHKIRSLTIKPVENSTLLDFTIVIQAMSLPKSTQKDKLTAEPSKPLKLSSLEDYKKVIVGRNLFAAYSPKPSNNSAKKEPKSEPKLDPLQFSYLTAIIEADGVPEAWVFERTTGKTFRLHEGENFTIGKVSGKLIHIGYNEIEIEIDGKSHTVGYGNSLKM